MADRDTYVQDFIVPMEGVDISLRDVWTTMRDETGGVTIDPPRIKYFAVGEQGPSIPDDDGIVMRATFELQPDGMHLLLRPRLAEDESETDEPVIDDRLRQLPDDIRHETIKELAKDAARAAAADAVAQVLVDNPDVRLVDLQQLGGVEPAEISRIKLGRYAEGPSLWKLAQIALLLNKRLKISIE